MTSSACSPAQAGESHSGDFLPVDLREESLLKWDKRSK